MWKWFEVNCHMTCNFGVQGRHTIIILQIPVLLQHVLNFWHGCTMLFAHPENRCKRGRVASLRCAWPKQSLTPRAQECQRFLLKHPSFERLHQFYLYAYDMLNLQTQLQVSIHRPSVHPLFTLCNILVWWRVKKLEPLGLGEHTPGVMALEKPLR